MVDSFERAKSSLKLETEAEQKIDSAYQGIYKQFVEVMKSIGVAAVETVGTEFDPQVRRASVKPTMTFPVHCFHGMAGFWKRHSTLRERTSPL